ncbi:hypothetical protein D0B54_17650 [Solimonas sp. K1W22B-7]|uniref:PilZ domain-containing protein n=1 Tax=Solimonas sp. K1W22B-7 TaxID=2303331 RepID=UPI000E333AD9|nr:PilZ domain-containing protein [Solimonas sp. K1W22B-7]AXQ30385.1 hypothetical protein D0B54_17650 [Solimonas sp. K1W22B-7]
MTDANPLENHLGYRDTLPLNWVPLATPPPPEQLQQLQENNLRVLAVVAALEDRHSPRGEADERVEQELERIHQKLDMLLVLFGQFLRRMDPSAPPRPLRLTSTGLSWEGGSALEGYGLVSLYLHPCMPEPFTWPAQAHNAGAVGEARFDPLGEALEAALEKHVFLHHRRSVAVSRPPAARTA